MNKKSDINVKSTLTSQKWLLYVIISIFTLIIIISLYLKQIHHNNQFTEQSKNNTLEQWFIDAPRGYIYDRYGKIIVDNQPIFTLYLTPYKYNREYDKDLSIILNIPLQKLEKTINNIYDYSQFRPSILIDNVDIQLFSNYVENSWRFTGIFPRMSYKRAYPQKFLGSHFLGYLGRNRKDKSHEKVGISGIEQYYDDVLKGETGKELLKVSAVGQIIGSYENNIYDIPPIQGKSIITTIDSELQYIAEDLMTEKRGSVIAMIPNTGEILAYVSSPDYNLDQVSNSNQWQTINQNENKPLYNRPILDYQPPGSTIKPLMGLIGLHMGLIDTSTVIDNTITFKAGNRYYQDLAPKGEYNLVKAIKHSSNYFFYSMMQDIIQADLWEEWYNYFHDFGFGRIHHIDLKYQNKGILPTRKYLTQRYTPYEMQHLIILGIGQGPIANTPLQLATYISSIANKGMRVTPKLVKSLLYNGTEEIIPTQLERIEWVNKDDMVVIHNGMKEVIEKYPILKIDDVVWGGKTGTVQLQKRDTTNIDGQLKDHSIFVGFAPLENAKIAVAVMIENVGSGAEVAAPLTSLIIEQYINKTIKRKWLYNHIKKITSYHSQPPRSVSEQ